MSRMQRSWPLLFCFLFLPPLDPAIAQSQGNQPIRIIVANSPGTVLDSLARVVGSEMSKFLNRTLIVENKPSSNSIVGYEYVARQMPADGNTMAVVAPRELEILPLIAKDLRFDPLKDLVPVIGLGEGRWIFGSPSTAPWKTFGELVAHIRKNPGKSNYGATSSQIRFPMIILIQDLGLDVVHIPYSGGGPYFQALVAGEIQMGFAAEAPAISFGGKFRALAVTGEQRREPFQDVPTFKELGLPKITGVSYSFNVRSGTPKSTIDNLHAAASKALDQPEVKAVFTKLRLEILKESPEVAARRLAEEAAVLADVAKKAGITPQ